MFRIRVLIADDHQVVREGLQRILAGESDMRVTALAHDGEAALRAARDNPPHVAVIDMRMPGGGLATIRKLRESCSDTKLLVLSMHDDERYTNAALNAGAHGYVSKRSGSVTLLAAIRSVHAGGRVAPITRPAQPTPSLPQLSAREREVMRMVLRGHTSRAVAERLGISKSSADTYRARIFQKLEVDSRAELFERVTSRPRKLAP